jgi:hypothetical protein
MPSCIKQIWRLLVAGFTMFPQVPLGNYTADISTIKVVSDTSSPLKFSQSLDQETGRMGSEAKIYK